MKILLIEDELKISKFIQKGLKYEGYTVTAVYNGNDGLLVAEDGSIDLIILDILLPDIDGISVLKKIRSFNKQIPIILLTAKDTIDDRVIGLDAGADDYIVKPFSFKELLARIRAISRRKEDKDIIKTIQAGDLILNAETFEVKRKGKRIVLSSTEFKLLKYLMENPHKVITKTMILENVWGYSFSPESNIVEVYIKYLRDKIDKGFKSSFIKTMHGIGYKLCV